MPARPVRILALAAALLAFAQRSVRAQTPAERPHAPILTLAPWAEDLWLALTDRDGAYFGRIAEQGTFQRFNPLMDSEYELDLRTGLFAAEEEGAPRIHTMKIELAIFAFHGTVEA